MTAPRWDSSTGLASSDVVLITTVFRRDEAMTPQFPEWGEPTAREPLVLRPDRWVRIPVGNCGRVWDRSEVLDGDLELISQPIDLLGINFYIRPDRRCPGRRRAAATEGVRYYGDGWEIHPPSLGGFPRWLDERYSFPKLMITENGCAMPDKELIDSKHGSQINDLDRLDDVQRHIAKAHSAVADGVPMVGYLIWSLFDNFEPCRGDGDHRRHRTLLDRLRLSLLWRRPRTGTSQRCSTRRPIGGGWIPTRARRGRPRHLDVEGVSRHNAPALESEGSAPQRILVKIHDDHAGVRAGDPIGVRVTNRHLHLFDFETGEAIAR